MYFAAAVAVTYVDNFYIFSRCIGENLSSVARGDLLFFRRC